MLTQSFHPQCLPSSFFDKSSHLALCFILRKFPQLYHCLFLAVSSLLFNFFLIIPSCLLLSILSCTCFKTSNLPFISLDILNIPWLRFLSDFSVLSSPWGVNLHLLNQLDFMLWFISWCFIILDGELTFYRGCLAFASAEVLRVSNWKGSKNSSLNGLSLETEDGGWRVQV